MTNYTCYHISNKQEIFPILQECMRPQDIHFHDGSNMNSFSQLVNTCVEKSPTEIVVMMSDKVRPSMSNLNKLLELLEQGYAFVGLYRFAFFGFKKELFRRIGPMDERFIGGDYEDNDYYLRLKEANLAMYLSHEVNYLRGPSTWNNDYGKEQFIKKWGKQVIHYKKAFRQFPEPIHNYNFGPSIDTEFLHWEYTKVIPTKYHKYLYIRLG